MPSSIREKQRARPQIIVQQSRNLPVPITISLIKPKRQLGPLKSTTVVNILKTVRFRSRNRFNAPPPQKRKLRIPICRWYRRKRALNQLVKEHKQEQKAIERKKQAKYEQERLRDFIWWESLKPQKSKYEPQVETKRKYKPSSLVEKLVKYKRSPVVEKQYKYTPVIEKTKKSKPTPIIEKKIEYKPPPVVEKTKKSKPTPIIEKEIEYKPPPAVEKQIKYYYQPTPIYEVPQKYEPKIEKQQKYKAPVVVAKTKECNGICMNEKSKKTQLRKKTKSVSVKKYNHRQSITSKFVNCFYRVCCQFYCYLTLIIIIVFLVICLI